MTDDCRGYLGFRSNTVHCIVVIHNAVYRKCQGAGAGALKLKVHAVATECFNCSSIQLCLFPVVAIDTKALMVIFTLFLDNTEDILFSIAQLEAQIDGKTFHAGTILTGQIVLGHHGNGAIFILNLNQPGVVIARIIGI